jgi:hypothetical protein
MCRSFIEQPRQVTFDWHIAQVLKWLKYDNGRHFDSVLIYASLELRSAIERYIFELLVLLKKGILSPDEQERCRSIKGVFDLMRETDQYYRQTVEFTKLIASVTPGLPELTIVDTAYLRRKWQDLSNYCHKQLDPSESFESPEREFQNQGFELINEILAKFNDWKFESVCGIILPDSMPSETKDVYDKFVAGEINGNQARRMLDVMLPILNARLKKK